VRFQDEIVDEPRYRFFPARTRGLKSFLVLSPALIRYFPATRRYMPVGALTTTDFRFGARPWELNAAASICPHCRWVATPPSTCAGKPLLRGVWRFKRGHAAPERAGQRDLDVRQGSLLLHYAESDERLTQPLMVRKGDTLEPAVLE